MALSNKQKVFIEEYLQCWNATEAARRAGYAKKYLHTNAAKLLQNTTILAEIERSLTEKTMSADEVLVRLAEQARAEYSHYLRPDGTVDMETMITDGKAHLIKSYKTIRDGLQIEFYDAQAALVHIGRHHKLFTDHVEHSGEVAIKGYTIVSPDDWDEPETG